MAGGAGGWLWTTGTALGAVTTVPVITAVGVNGCAAETGFPNVEIENNPKANTTAVNCFMIPPGVSTSDFISMAI
jgi:hypothetical protein